MAWWSDIIDLAWGSMEENGKGREGVLETLTQWDFKTSPQIAHGWIFNLGKLSLYALK